jgi:hypothetical protein
VVRARSSTGGQKCALPTGRACSCRAWSRCSARSSAATSGGRVRCPASSLAQARRLGRDRGTVRLRPDVRPQATRLDLATRGRRFTPAGAWWWRCGYEPASVERAAGAVGAGGILLDRPQRRGSQRVLVHPVEPGTRAALVCLCNFSPVVGKDHRVGLPRAGRLGRGPEHRRRGLRRLGRARHGGGRGAGARLGRSARIGPDDPAAPSDRLADPKLRARKIRGSQAWVVQCRSANGTTPGQEAGRRSGLRALDRSLTVSLKPRVPSCAQHVWGGRNLRRPEDW